jgi:hypothetical protein
MERRLSMIGDELYETITGLDFGSLFILWYKKIRSKGDIAKRLPREIYRGFRSKMAISSLITERQPEKALQVVVLIGR